MARKYLPVYPDFEALTEELTDEELGGLLRAMLSYFYRGDGRTKPCGNARFVWPAVRRTLDQCIAKAEEKQRNGALGGRPRETSQNQPKPTETNANQTKPHAEQQNQTPTCAREQEQEQEQKQEQEQEQKQKQEQRALAREEAARRTFATDKNVPIKKQRVDAREGATAPAPPAAPDHLRGSANVIQENRSDFPNSSQQVANQSQFSRNSVASSPQVVAKNATTTAPLEEPVIAFDGTDLSADMDRCDAVERLIKRYKLADNDATLSALLEDADRYGLPAVESALSRATMSDRRGGISVNFYRRFLGSGPASCAQAPPPAAPYGGGSGHSPPPDTSNPFLVLLQREEENAREQGGDP